MNYTAENLGDALSGAESNSLGGQLERARLVADNDDGRSKIELAALIGKGWRATYSAVFGEQFVEVLAPHHIEAIVWHWFSRMSFIGDGKPEFWAYFPIWSRGHMKSTVARYMAIIDALLSVNAGLPAYILYVSRNSSMASKHAASIETIISSEAVKRICPQLSRVKKSEQGASKGWRATFLNTEANVIFHFGGLDEGMAGGNVDNVRPTLIVPDDIDGREDSPVIAESRFEKLTLEVLPMRQSDTLVFFPQNLISRYSVMYRINSGQARVLTNRKPTQPIPALIDLKTVTATENGIVQDIIVAGTPTWKFYDLDRCQEEINTIGLPAFLRECQHEVAQSKEGLILHNYDDAVHVISYSEFAAVYGSPEAWKDWFKVVFNDWSRTKTEKHANVAGFVAVSSQNTLLPALTFYIPLSFPANRMPEDVAERLLSTLQPFAYDTTTWRQLINDAMKRANAEQHFTSTADILDYSRSYLKNAIYKYARKVLSAYHVMAGAMSHSEDTVRQIFNEVFGFPFIPSNPSRTDAIEDITRALSVDYGERHLFRPEKMGYTRAYILAPDDTSQIPELVNEKLVYPPRRYPDALQPHELHDSDLMRYQFTNWRWREPVLTATGETVDDVLKINDDFGQGLQMIYFKRLLSNIPLSNVEKRELHLSPSIREIAIAQLPDSNEKDTALQKRAMEMKRVEKELNKPVKHPGVIKFGRR